MTSPRKSKFVFSHRWIHRVARLLVLSAAVEILTAQSPLSLKLETYKTHSRLSLPLDTHVETQWTESNGRFEILLRGIGLQDLYLSSEDLSKLGDSRVGDFSVRERADGIVLSGIWRFPNGEQAVANPKMEKFTYRENNPSRYVIDFWPKAGATVQQVRIEKKRQERQESIRRAEVQAQQRRNRKIAAQRALEIESDIARFCKVPLKDGEDTFLEFFPEHEYPSFSDALPVGPPDEGYPYLDPNPSNKEAESIRLALELYKKRDYALAVRAVDFITKDSPKNLHEVDLKFLKANALLRLELKDQADRLFEKIRESHPGTPAALASALYLADQAKRAGNTLQAVDRYLWVAIHYPHHRNTWVWRMVAAESLYQLKQTDRAIREYEWVVKNGPDANSRAMAATRIGDAYLFRAQYDRALAAYFEASRDFPKEVESQAAAQINRGEALYWLGQLDRAEQQFRNFNEKFPGHPAGWRAFVRLGEIEGRKSDTPSQERSRNAFLSTINHYPFSPGAVIARMRLLPCGDHAGFDSATAADFFKKEVSSFDGSGQIRMEKFAEFRSIVRVRSMVMLNDPVAALDAAIQEREEISKKSRAYGWLRGMERKIFKKEILSRLDQGKKFEAVALFDQYSKRIDLREELPEDATPEQMALADPDYLLRLSRVASEIGLSKTAQTIANSYHQLSKDSGFNRTLASNGSQLDQRLKSSEIAFTEAKALWMSPGKKDIDLIRSKLSGMSDESPFAYQKEIILGLIAASGKSFATALNHASKSTMLLSHQVKESSVDRVALDQWIADLQSQAGNTRAALEMYRKLQTAQVTPGVRAKAEGVGLPPIRTREAWIFEEAEMATRLAKHGEAADAYARAIQEGLGGNRAKVQYALSLEKVGGSAEKVQEILKQVADSKVDDFWKELARKKLASATAMEGNSL